MPSAPTSLHQTLSLADGSHVRAAMIRLTSEFGAGRWLGRSNPYGTDPVGAIRNQVQPGPPLRHRKLVDYVAVSAILHCFDGWSYLGRALQAEMACDPDSARHLGYYAELRAAMAVLASAGIGVFNWKHIVVCGTGACHRIDNGGGTHQFVWKALEYWADAQAKDVLLRVIRLGGVPISDWLNQFHSASVNALAADWLKTWGLDLKRYADDRKARNTASYRPTALESTGPRQIDGTMRSVVQLWRGLEPTGSAVFHDLDQHLLRHMLELVFRNGHRYGRSVRQARRQYLRRVNRMLIGLPLTDVARRTFRTFLDPVPPKSTSGLLSDARGTLPSGHIDHSKQLIARATLLLRLSTGCARELLDGATTEPRDMLRFWWSEPAVRRRLWQEKTPPMLFSDLWEDVSEALNGVETWLEGPETAKGAYDFWNERATEAAILSTTERICLWGLGT